MDCKQPSKSDQVPDLNEKANERYQKPVAFGTINNCIYTGMLFPGSYAISWLECFAIM